MHILEYENYQETKKHYDADFSYNTYLCSVPMDFRCVPMHWHNEMELIYVKNGTGSVCVDGIQYKVVQNSVVIILPGTLHSIAQFEDKTFEYENIIFDINMLLPKQGDTMSYGFFHRILNQSAAFPPLIDETLDCHRAVLECLDRIDDLRITYPAGYYLGIKGWLYQLFFILESHILSQSPSTPASNPHKYKNSTRDKLMLITDYIACHYQQKISIEQIAAVCEFSCSHFMKFFKLHMGKTFIEYLNDYRLLQAARLLAASDDDILAIAMECGFENVSYFNRLFLREYGMTPSKFRKAHITS